MLKLEDVNLVAVGLGYVSLPLAVEFGKKMSLVGFDICRTRDDALKFSHDSTCEVSGSELKSELHRATNIKKATSGFTQGVAGLVDLLFGGIITAGAHKVQGIYVTAAAETIENTLRDFNIEGSCTGRLRGRYDV